MTYFINIDMIKRVTTITVWGIMEAGRMTLKAAAAYLKETGYSFSQHTIRKAVSVGKLPARLEDAPIPYYTVLEADLLAWASNPEMHKAGRRWN